MEFEDEHDEEQEEEEDEDEDEITIPPPAPLAQVVVPPGLNSGPPSRARVSTERRSGVVRYRECVKNHAVSIGGHALDGCGEFMAAGEEGTLDALKCAACNCHRNFHRKEADHSGDGLPLGGGSVGVNHTFHQQHHQLVSPAGAVVPAGALYPQQFSAYYRTPGSGSGYPHYLRPPLAALPSNSGGTHSGEMGDDVSHPSSSGGGDGRPESGGGGRSAMTMNVPRKRFRTKFTQDQKHKMFAFAEKVGWRIQKHDEAAVQQFCAEVQINRQVLKVWMHNNKHTLGKKPEIN